MGTKLDIAISINYGNQDELFEDIKNYLQKIRGNNDLDDNNVVHKINELNIASAFMMSLGFEIYDFRIQEDMISLSFSEKLKSFILKKLQLAIKKDNYGFHSFITEINVILDIYVRSLQSVYELARLNLLCESNTLSSSDNEITSSQIIINLPVTSQICTVNNNIIDSNEMVLKISRNYDSYKSSDVLDFEIFLEFENRQDFKDIVLYCIDNKYFQVI